MHRLLPLAAVSAALSNPFAAAAQTAAPGTVLITGNPLRSSDAPPAATVLAGDELVRRRGPTLAETLEGEPGLAASWFGPAASRPVIRGQDGDRIRLLSGGGATFDASALSSDHAVPIDPLAVERIEVLRGPAVLLYGGSAGGGVVNVIDNRIPSVAVSGLAASGELRLGGAASERSAAMLVETGRDGFSWHADGFARRSDELSVPAFEVDGERRTRLANSDSRAEGGAIGGSVAWRDGHAGLALDGFRTRYGSIAEDTVRLSMKRDRLAAAGEWRALPGAIETVRASASRTDYRHDEIEDGAIGTTFRNRGSELRVEAVHRSVAWAGGRLHGVLGLQAERARFEALGEEAFVPTTDTRSAAAFALETWTRGPWTLRAGARAERVVVRSHGDPGDADEARVGPASQRRFSPRSASVGGVLRLGGGWSAEGSWSATQRAPASYELFADGVHVATAAFERGDASLAVERGRHAEASLAWAGPLLSLKATAFATRFSQYIALLASGETVEGEDGEVLPVLAFSGVRARLAGAEVQASGEIPVAQAKIAWRASADTVRGDNRSSGEPLPRIAPRRARLALDWVQGAWRFGGAVQQVARQARVPVDDTATPGFTRLDLGASWRGSAGGRTLLAFVQIGNVTDRLGFNASTVSTVRALAPLPGRSLRAGLRVSY